MTSDQVRLVYANFAKVAPITGTAAYPPARQEGRTSP